MRKVDVFISVNSPWAFLGWQPFLALRDQYRLDVTVKPAKFGDVFAATGGLPLPKRAPERRAYRLMELKRWREWHGVPLILEPKHFPSDETPASRLIIAAQLQGRDACRLSAEIGHALWVNDESIADPLVLAKAAARAGLDTSAIMAASPSNAELDAIWEANTRDAVARGVFGAPSYVLETGETFWGQDRVPLLGWRLAGGGKAKHTL